MAMLIPTWSPSSHHFLQRRPRGRHQTKLRGTTWFRPSPWQRFRLAIPLVRSGPDRVRSRCARVRRRSARVRRRSALPDLRKTRWDTSHLSPRKSGFSHLFRLLPLQRTPTGDRDDRSHRNGHRPGPATALTATRGPRGDDDQGEMEGNHYLARRRWRPIWRGHLAGKVTTSRTLAKRKVKSSTSSMLMRVRLRQN